MRLGEGTEWGLHCCVTLGWLTEAGPVSIAKLAGFFDLPQEYLKKRLQPLVKAGLLSSAPGPRGGFALARPPERITLLDVVTALEGPAELFRCAEIRQQGVGAVGGKFEAPCGIAGAMRRAELAWRRELAAQTIADLMEHAPEAAERTRRNYARLSS